MKAFFLLTVVVGAVLASDAVRVEKQQEAAEEAVKAGGAERAALVRAAQEAVELGARTGTVGQGAAEFPLKSGYWPYVIPPWFQLPRSDAEDAAAYYKYDATDPYYSWYSTYYPYSSYYYGSYYPYNWYYPYSWYYDNWQK